MVTIRFYWILYIYCTSAGIFSLYLFIHKQCENAKEWVFHNDFDASLDKEYDFIVVGGGSAGSLVAARLAETDKNVLLIEAGGKPSIIHDIPLTAPMIQKSSYDWQYVTVPQENSCLGLTNHRSNWPRGKILGGTSRLNYMVYLRGHKMDFDKWTKGADWTFTDILHYFKKSENQLGNLDSFYHGYNGPIYVSDLKFQTQLSQTLLKAGDEIGYNTVELNRLESPGMMQVQVTGFNGARWSADYALKKCLNQNYNLKVLTNTLVEKVIFRNRFEAYAIQYRRNSYTGIIKAKKSIIISAGTVNSPKILMLSGIGHTEELLKHKIEPLVDLPVGENLQDHITTGLDLVLLNTTLPLSHNAILNSPINIYKYIIKGEGIMTHPGCEVVGLFHLENDTLPDIQLMALPGGVSTDAGAVLRDALGISQILFDDYFSPLVGKQVATILPTVLHPKSIGNIKLSSSDIFAPPIIDPKYLSNPYDVKILIKGLKLIEKLINTSSLQKMGAKLYKKPITGCKHLKFATDSYWECYIRHLTITAYHPVGTCKMGDKQDSVVDHNLRVHKTNKLFVIDASIMPTLPSANINAAVMMIAEKGADIIKYLYYTEKHKCKLIDIFIPVVTTSIS